MFESGPKYRVIIGDYIRMIESGELRPGERLPTVRALAEMRRVSHATATKALRELCRAGFAYVEGNGTYVRDRSHVELTVTRLNFGGRKRSGGGGNGAGGGHFAGPAQLPGWNEITAADIVIPPPYVSHLMELEPGMPVLRREWVRRWRPRMDGPDRLDPEPPLKAFELAVSWLPARYAEISPSLLITGLDDSTAPLPDNGYGVTLAEQAEGRSPFTGMEMQHVRVADEREARLLGIAEGEPVLACVETWEDDHGVSEYREMVYPVGVVRMTEYRDPDDHDEE